MSAGKTMQKREKGAARSRKPRSEGVSDTSTPLPQVIGANLKTMRTRQGYSLERLAKLAGVSRAMLSQIENGQSVPTILLLLKVANALKVPLATLVTQPKSRQVNILTRESAKILSASGGRFTMRPLFPLEAGPRVAFYEAVIAACHSEQLDPHPSGAKENLVVVKGRVELTVGREAPVLLAEGDAAFLPAADAPRIFHNPGISEAVFHLVVNLAGTIAR
jgi:transcriptional regulator with XRE-family HTH domain